MDLLLAVAAESGALAAIANDPDADRLGAAIPQPDGSWRRLGGDEIGWLLAEHILDHTSGDDRLVVTTLVSSSLLGRMAAAVRRALRRDVHRLQVDRPHRARPPERAIRVRVRAGARLPRDAPAARQGRHHRRRSCSPRWRRRRAADGVTLQDRLDAIAARYGRHVMAELSVRMEPAVAAAQVEALRASPPAEVAGRRVVEVSTVPRGRPAAADARRRRPGADPPERYRAEGQAVRRSRRTRTRRPTSPPSPPSSRDPCLCHRYRRSSPMSVTQTRGWSGFGLHTRYLPGSGVLGR